MADNWFNEMSKAVRAREIALAGLERWQAKVAAAEEVITQLTAQRDAAPAAPSVDDQQAEVAAAVPPALQPIFGVSTPDEQQ